MTSAGTGAPVGGRRQRSRGDRLVLGPWPEDLRRLFRFIDWILELLEALEERFWDELITYQREKKMRFIDIAERKERERATAAGPGRPAGARLHEEFLSGRLPVQQRGGVAA